MVEVLVEYDYSAQKADELTIKKGDIIKDVIRKPGGWWEGTLHDKKGVFPDNFVRLVDKDSVVLRSKKDSQRIRQCRVIFSYNQDHEDELNLKVGDTINVICEEEEGWWRGILNGKEGVFPSNFVEEIAPAQSRPKPSSREEIVRLSDEAPALPAKPVKQLCEVRYAYKAQNEDELTLKEGDIITIITKDCQDPGWWKGEINGRMGVFPDNFVQILPFTTEDNKKIGFSYKVDSKLPAETSAIKPSSIASQRKSLEVKGTPAPAKNPESTRTTPPLPGKKPIISLKKSPSGSGSGLFSKLKDKLDGATGSKLKTDVAKETKETKENNIESGHPNASVFDQVERRPLLSDVRANRARPPGRRLPTSVYKEEEDDETPGLPNGTADHVKSDHTIKSEHSVKSEDSFKSEGSASSENLDNSSSDLEASEAKPKLREWEKHKAPWLAEMKLNQAKRTSVSPVPDLKPKAPEPKPDSEVSKSSHNSPAEKEVNLIDMSKSMTDIKISPVDLKPIPKPYKTPPNELDKDKTAPPIKRNNQPSKDSPSRTVAPQPTKISPKPKVELYENATVAKSQSGVFSSGLTSISSGSTSISTSHTSHSSNFTHTSTEKVVSSSSTTVLSGSSLTGGTTTTGGLANMTSSSSNSITASKLESGTVTSQMFNELLERVAKLESKCEKQGQQIEDLKNRLQVETDMRMMLQEKVLQSSIQV